MPRSRPTRAPARRSLRSSSWPRPRAREFVVPIAASAWPSGPVDDRAFDHIARRICDAVAQGCDGVLLDLHGAMVTQSHDDGEGELLRRIRAIAPNVPIAAAMDMHTNLYDAFAQKVRRDRRLPDLSAHRHVRDRPTRRPRAAGATAGQSQADDGMGPPADAAARDAPGQRRFAQPRAAGALPADGSARRVVRHGVRRLSQRRHRIRRAVGGGGDRQRSRTGAPLVRRAAGDGVVAAHQVRLRGAAAGRVDRAGPVASPPPSRPAAARWCCSITATTAHRAARWTR